MLVDYSDSEEEARDIRPSKKRKGSRDGDARLPPPLPSAFRSLYATNVRAALTDDPALHGGRTRQVAHQKESWPTHIYLEWYPPAEDLDKLEVLVNQAQEADDSSKLKKVHSSLRSDLGVPLPLHISLSAPLVLKTGQKDALLEDLTTMIASSGAQIFNVKSVETAWVSNSDQTRHFLVLKLSRPDNDDLNKLLRACNAWARKHELSELYVESMSPLDKTEADRTSAFHVSIAWALSKPKSAETGFNSNRQVNDLDGFEITLREAKVKIGNVVTDIPLPDRLPDAVP